ncbi:MAG: hypothetical protein JJ964_15415 [Rhizobiales bacterium]|nr:hypothetical protein [Hyphomicrobiales bacterium]
MKIGDKVKFEAEKQRYTLQAFNQRFFILTKPFNAQKTYLYTIVDLEREVRGRCNLVLGLPHDCNSPEDAEVCLKWLEGHEDEHGYNEMEVSYRNNMPLTDQELEIFRGNS